MKKLTKKQEEILRRYYNSNNYSLNDIYKSYSFEKGRAEALIKNEMLEKNGHGYKVLGRNTFSFSCAYTYYNELGETVLVYHTASNRKEFIID